MLGFCQAWRTYCHIHSLIDEEKQDAVRRKRRMRKLQHLRRDAGAECYLGGGPQDSTETRGSCVCWACVGFRGVAEANPFRV